MKNVLGIFFLLCLTTASFGQSNVSSGDVKGTLRDAQGAVIVGAQITVTHIETGAVRTATSNEEGQYLLLSLRPGQYSVRTEFMGFTPQLVPMVDVVVGQTVVLDFSLEVGSVTETVTVSASAPIVQPERSQQSNVIAEESIRSLPIDRRDYLTFTLLAPGVVDSTAFADNSDFRVVQTPQSGLS